MRAVFQADHKKRFQADKKSKPADTKSTLERSREILASAQKPPVQMNAWQRYRHLQSLDAKAAGIYWRANKQAIVDCIE